MELDIEAGDGRTSRSFRTSFKYVEEFEPSFFLFENVYDKQTAVKVMACIRTHCPAYEVGAWAANAADYGNKGSRTRVWIAGANTKKVTVDVPLSEWGSTLTTLQQVRPYDLDYFRLKDESPEIKEALATLKAKAGKRTLDGASGSTRWKTGNSMFDQHEHLREAYKKEGLTIPSLEEFLKNDTIQGWEQYYTSKRAQDLVHIQRFVAMELDGVDTTRLPLVWDRTRSMYYRFEKTVPDRIPCALTTHDYYRTDLKRDLLGVEVLMAQGFPRTIKIAGGGITGEHVKRLAGNTQAISMVGKLLACAWKFIRFQKPGGGLTAIHNTMTEAEWVSPPCVRKTSLKSVKLAGLAEWMQKQAATKIAACKNSCASTPFADLSHTCSSRAHRYVPHPEVRKLYILRGGQTVSIF